MTAVVVAFWVSLAMLLWTHALYPALVALLTRAARMRPVTPREVAILTRQLEDSLSSASGLELDTAIKEHRELRGRRMRSPEST